MAADKAGAGAPAPTITLIVRKTKRATPARLFAAWTQAAQLRQWWGPESVDCVDAQVDLRVGGRYRRAASRAWRTTNFTNPSAPQARIRLTP